MLLNFDHPSSPPLALPKWLAGQSHLTGIGDR